MRTPALSLNTYLTKAVLSDIRQSAVHRNSFTTVTLQSTFYATYVSNITVRT
jgi:hypothetical protein